MNNNFLYQYILGVADNSLVLGQRLGELCGHGPNLETDIACTNYFLGSIGTGKKLFSIRRQLRGGDTKEDDIAFFKD